MFVFDALAKSVFEQIVGSPQDKERAQEQLAPVLERRLEPCLELWKDLWQFGDDVQQRQKRKEAFLADDDLRRLLTRVDAFMLECGALISPACLVSLAKFQVGLRAIDLREDELLVGAKVRELFKQLFPWSEKDGNGKLVQNPGLLMLLRDEIGSNTRAGFGALK